MTLFIGREGEYQIHNPQFISQSKLNLEGEPISKRIVHLTAESIENQEDKEIVKRKLYEIGWREIEEALVE
ncbi:MAG: hypothetical protein U5K00_23760 [Melioribacteraceae bacterium]|nr:hypothetical protein [Melioribacteraceae bacterium]